MQILKKRPPGTATLGVLAIAASILCLFNVFGETVLSIFAPSIANHAFDIDLGALPVSLLPGSLMAISNIVLISIGAANTVAAILLLKGKMWSWNVALAVSCIGVAFGAISTLAEEGRPALEGLVMNAALMGIEGAIVVYLFKPNVREFFGKFVSGYDDGGDAGSDEYGGYAMDNATAAE